MWLRRGVVEFIKRLLEINKKEPTTKPKKDKLTLGPIQRSYLKMKRKNGDKNA